MRKMGTREHLATLFRHRGKIATVFLTTVFIAGLGSFLPAKVYEAHGRILIHQNREPLRFGAVLTPSLLGGGSEQANTVQTEVEIFKSRVPAERVVEDLGAEYVLENMRWRWDWLKALPGRLKDSVVTRLYDFDSTRSLLLFLKIEKPGGPPTPEERKWAATLKLREHLEAAPMRKADVFEVGFKAPRPEFAASALNKLIEHYLEYHQMMRQGEAGNTLYAEEARRLNSELLAAEERVQEYKKKWGIVDIDTQKRLLLNRISDTDAAYRKARMEALESEHRIAEIKRQLKFQPQAIQLNTVSRRNPAVDDLKARLVKLELERDQYVPSSAAAIKADREIEALKARLQAEESKVLGSATSGVNRTYQDLQEAIVMEESRLKVLQARLALKDETAEYLSQLNALDEREAMLRDLKRDVELKEEALRLYLRKQEESRVGAVLDSKRIFNVTPLEPAEDPVIPVAPRKFRNLVVGIIVGFLGGIGIAYLCEFFRRSFSTKEEVQDQLGLPVLASFLKASRSADKAAIGVVEMRHLVKAFMKWKRQNSCKRLLFASTMTGEGKSYVASEFATSLGAENVRILLVETEFPTVAKRKRRPWRSKKSQETERIPIQECGSVPVATSAPNVSKLAVPRVGMSTRAYCDRISDLVKNLQGQYEVIVIDGPALGESPDGGALSALADATIIVVEADRTNGELVMQALKTLDGVKDSMLGVVLNKRRFVIPRWMYSLFLAPRSGRLYG